MVYAKKSYGQHFLKEPSVLHKIVEAAEVGPNDFVVEIGPGRGALTEYLVPVCKNLLLIEADPEMISVLKEKNWPVQIIQADAAQFDYAAVASGPWILIGNLPYNAAAAIIMQALTSSKPPTRAVVMVQKEVAEKMLAKPGQMGLLSLAVQMYARVTRVVNVKPGSFSPPPKVDSTVVRLDIESAIRADAEAIIALAKIGFSTPRKQLHGTLAAAGAASSEKVKNILLKLGLPASARPQELSKEQWIKLKESLNLV